MNADFLQDNADFATSETGNLFAPRAAASKRSREGTLRETATREYSQPSESAPPRDNINAERENAERENAEHKDAARVLAPRESLRNSDHEKRANASREYSHDEDAQGEYSSNKSAPRENGLHELPNIQQPASRANAPCVWTIAGLDPSGGAGLFADARAMSAFGAHCCGVATAIVPQNTRGAARCDAVSSEIVAAQIDELLRDIPMRAIKIGLLPNATLAGLVASRVLAWREKNAGSVVLDTVFAPSSGARFCDAATVQTIARRLLPLCDLITPNLSEAATLGGLAKIEDESAMREAARRISSAYGAPRVLVKGGHLRGDALDVLYEAASRSYETFRAPRIENREVRGTGCLLASAIAAQLAHDVEMRVAIETAKTWLTARIENAQMLGSGRRIAL